ncbi:hypothetical protein V6N13_024546 [Hibiscus sabdariffa]
MLHCDCLRIHVRLLAPKYDVPEGRKSLEGRNSLEGMKASKRAKVITSEDDVLEGSDGCARVSAMNKMVLEMLHHMILELNFVEGDGPRPVASVLEFDFDSIEPKERTSSNKMGENKVDMLESNIPEQHKPLFPSYETSRLMSQCSTRIVQHRPKEGKGKNM